MADTTFIDGSTVIMADWLNDVNSLVYGGSGNVAPATSIASASASINTTGKFQGKMVYDTTNHRLMIADGSGATAPWYIADGSGSVTPS